MKNFILFFILIFSSHLLAFEFDHWINASQIVDKHEFYKDNEVIDTPKETNQVLFAVEFTDDKGQVKKDCVIYKVPGNELGILKVKNINQNDKCSDYLFQKGDIEWNELRSLQYSLNGNFISFHLALKNYEVVKFDVPQVSQFKKPEVKMNLSSSEMKFPKIIYYPVKNQERNLKDGISCLSVKDDCSLVGKSTCSQCENGWYEIPNGCSIGPKVCGQQICGRKNSIACRRGYKYQLQDKKYHCSEDSSFSFCMKGLRVQCQGNLAYCI